MTTQREILFDELTAKDVAERLRLIDACNNYLNAVALTVARLNGVRADSRIGLNQAGTGILIHDQATEPWEGDGTPEAAADSSGKRQK